MDEPNGSTLGSRPALISWLWLFLLAITWFVFFREASRYWDPESHYFFGWIVPPLAAYLLKRRWERVEPLLDNSGALRRSACYWILPVLLIAFLLIRLVAFADLFPLWRLPVWMLGIASITVSMLCFSAGLGWRAAVFFAWPCIFCLTALPWPTALHVPIVDGLTKMVAESAVVFLRFAGHPAELVGQHILVGEETVEVGEACSGIRSLQALVMCSIFLGELGRLGWFKRVSMLVAAVGVAFIFNAARALVLGIVAVESGPEVFEQWHDLTGAVSFNAAWITLFVIFNCIDEPDSKPEHSSIIPLSRPTPAQFLVNACLTVMLAVTEPALSRLFPYRLLPAYDLDPSYVDTVGFYERNPISETSQSLLGFDEGQSLTSVIGGRQVHWSFFKWNGGVPLKTPNEHTPDQCMGVYGGLEFLGRGPSRLFTLPGLVLVFDPYRFQSPRGTVIQIYRAVVSAESENALDGLVFDYDITTSHTAKFAESFRFLFTRRSGGRALTQRLLLIGITDAPPDTEAWAFLEPHLAEILRTQLESPSPEPGVE